MKNSFSEINSDLITEDKKYHCLICLKEVDSDEYFFPIIAEGDDIVNQLRSYFKTFEKQCYISLSSFELTLKECRSNLESLDLIAHQIKGGQYYISPELEGQVVKEAASWEGTLEYSDTSSVIPSLFDFLEELGLKWVFDDRDFWPYITFLQNVAKKLRKSQLNISFRLAAEKLIEAKSGI